jgi:hypothetical protein
MAGEQEAKQQVGIRKSTGDQGGRPQLADMEGRPFLDGPVPLPEPRTARVGCPSVYSRALAERICDEIERGVSIPQPNEIRAVDFSAELLTDRITVQLIAAAAIPKTVGIGYRALPDQEAL